MVKFSDHSEILEFRTFFQKLQIPISTSFPPHFPLTLHLTPLILSLSHSRPSGQVRDTSPLPFCKKTPLFHLNSNPFTKSQSYIYLSLCKLLLFFLISTQELSSLQTLFFLNLNPSSKNTSRPFPPAQASDLELGSWLTSSPRIS